MSKAEKFIQENTRKLTQYGDDYFLWITPDNAKEAVEIAREEIYKWLNKKLSTYIDYRCRGVGESIEEFINDLKQAMKNE